MIRNITLLAALAGIASAATIQLGNNPSGIETNVLLTGGATGMTVSGTAGLATVNFTSSQTLTNPSNGQARTEATTGLLTNITFGPLAGFTFGDVIFNAFCQGAKAGCGSTLNVSVSDGTTQSLALGNGQNFVTITGTALTSVSLSSVGGFSDLRQVRFSDLAGPGIPPTGAVPEPGTVAMLATGIGVILFGVRRKRA